MISCNYCNKTYKTQNGLNKHLSKLHNNRDDKFEYFSLLPLELHYEIFKFLNYSDLLSVFKAKITHIFYSEMNYQWEERFGWFYQNIMRLSGRKFFFKSYGLTLLKYYNSLCFFCFGPCTYRTIDNPFYYICICSDCQKSHLPMITKTTAKTRYLLKDEDLAKLKSICVENPYYKKASEMVLFLEKDCQNMAPDNLADLLAKKEEKSMKRKENKEKKINERRKELQRALGAVGLKIRKDSKLCNGYIHGTLDKDEWSLADVVKMCQEMHWLHTKTNYREMLDKELKKSIKDEKECYGHYNFDEIYNIVEPMVREQVKINYSFLR